MEEQEKGLEATIYDDPNIYVYDEQGGCLANTKRLMQLIGAENLRPYKVIRLGKFNGLHWNETNLRGEERGKPYNKHIFLYNVEDDECYCLTASVALWGCTLKHYLLNALVSLDMVDITQADAIELNFSNRESASLSDLKSFERISRESIMTES